MALKEACLSSLSDAPVQCYLLLSLGKDHDTGSGLWVILGIQDMDRPS